MADRDDGLLVATMPFDAMVPRLERRPVAACGRQAGLDQGTAQVSVALTGSPVQGLHPVPTPFETFATRPDTVAAWAGAIGRLESVSSRAIVTALVHRQF
jgi:hypothetical protein